jgi:hypothetical protein
MQNKPRPESQQPLGMTVYDLPAPDAVAQNEAKRTATGRLRMLLVALVCAAPVVASYFTYYVIRPEARRNFGELIQPTRALPQAKATSLDGKAVDLPSLKGQWLFISVFGGACTDSCQKALYMQRQILTGLGKDKPRTEWVWLISDDQDVPKAIQPGLKEATVLRVDPAVLKQWLQITPDAELSDSLYLVDPMGEWMMRFPSKLDTEGAVKVKRDLERLLRASASWDEAGR